jgi:hypothetical protein
MAPQKRWQISGPASDTSAALGGQLVGGREGQSNGAPAGQKPNCGFKDFLATKGNAPSLIVVCDGAAAEPGNWPCWTAQASEKRYFAGGV